MRGKEARKACPNLVLVQVPCENKKSNINLYREAGAEVVTVLSRFATACERSSIDEVSAESAHAQWLRGWVGELGRWGGEGQCREPAFSYDCFAIQFAMPVYTCTYMCLCVSVCVYRCMHSVVYVCTYHTQVYVDITAAAVEEMRLANGESSCTTTHAATLLP